MNRFAERVRARMAVIEERLLAPWARRIAAAADAARLAEAQRRMGLR